VLETQRPGPELARAYARMAGHLYVAGRNADVPAWADKAIALADELGMEGEAVFALQYRGAARAELGDGGGLEDLRRALRLGLELGLGNETAITYNNLAYERWFWEGPASAQETWDEMEAFCRVRGFRTMATFAQGGALESLLEHGEWDRVLRWEREHGPTRVSIAALTYRGWVHLRRGDIDEAAAACEEVLPLARGIGYAEYLAPTLVLAAEVALARDRRPASRGHVEDFLATTVGARGYRTMFLPVVVRMLVALGDLEVAIELVEATGEQTTSRHRLGLLSARATVAEAAGDPAGAQALYREAAVGWGEYRFALECARVSLGAGRCLLALDRGEEAVRFLTEARRLLEPLGARPLLGEIRGLLEGGPLRPP
jgi:tetratricopeptide (TPR) repeat protein